MDRFIDEAIKAGVAILVPVIATYVCVVLHRLAKKFGLEVSAEQDLKVRAGVQNILLGIEEAARAAAARNGADIPSSDEKLTDAMLQVVNDPAIPIESSVEAETIINQELPKVRAAIAMTVPQPGTAA